MKQTPTENLLNEVRLLYQSMVRIGDEIHADRKMSMGMRAVLEYLAREGNTTVPQMARARRVSRQRVQTLVDKLLERGLVSKVENPDTQRSQLISVTQYGLDVIQAMRRIERDILPRSLDKERVFDAIETLKEIRRSMEQIL
ncbi:MAG: MarR family transcriptional regulator [Pseudomonadota bacterium]